MTGAGHSFRNVRVTLRDAAGAAWPTCTCGQRFPSRRQLDAHLTRGGCVRPTRLLAGDPAARKERRR